jgi:hypothetical protein
MRSILPLDLPDIHQAQIGFVDEGCGLEGPPGTFARHVPARGGVQLIVHKRHQLLQGGFITLSPSLEKTSYFL